MTRNRTKRKIQYEDKTKSVFIGKTIKDISFINYAWYTDIINIIIKTLNATPILQGLSVAPR